MIRSGRPYSVNYTQKTNMATGRPLHVLDEANPNSNHWMAEMQYVTDMLIRAIGEDGRDAFLETVPDDITARDLYLKIGLRLACTHEHTVLMPDPKDVKPDGVYCLDCKSPLVDEEIRVIQRRYVGLPVNVSELVTA